MRHRVVVDTHDPAARDEVQVQRCGAPREELTLVVLPEPDVGCPENRSLTNEFIRTKPGMPLLVAESQLADLTRVPGT